MSRSIIPYLVTRDAKAAIGFYADAFGAVSPDTLGGTAVTLHLATDTVDADVARAVAAGATLLRAPADQSFGERTATLTDPFGHRWMLSQTIEVVSPEDMQKRWDAETSA